jgi:hypothetical protein
MSLWGKNRPSFSPTRFMSNFIHNFYLGKSRPKICATSVIIKKLSNENNRPIGVNLPNLVTLIAARIHWYKALDVPRQFQ